ncbi:tyrosine-type recombinase/integrase [Pantoea ananatis]|uniref:tyrosine-type recombinase/integrase n=1 Tax=Pantoea ananas TaxID=553 RepID=UPI001B300323|nr:site-specific integrase [Pantoea ananatis]
MALTDSYLRSVLGREHEGVFEKTDRDGLSVRVSKKGKVVFQMRYMFAGKQRRVDIGSYPSLGLREARDEILKIRRALEEGVDPQLYMAARYEKNVTAMTVEQVVREWARVYAQANIKNFHGIMRSFEIHVFPVIGHLPHDSVGTHTWIEVIESVQAKRPGIARRLLTNAKQAHSWALRRKMVESAPVESLKPHDLGMKINVTKRVLNDDEIRALFETFENTGMRRKNALLLQLILLFGCRSGEMIQSKREHFDFESGVWTVPAENHKGGQGGKPLRRPIIPAAQEMIQEAMTLSSHKEFIFQSALAKDRERALNSSSALGLPKTVMAYYQRTRGEIMPHWSVHDLRRTARTRWASIAPPHVCEVMLGHALPGIWAVYDHNDYIDEQRKAYTAWWALVMKIVNGESKVRSIVTM